METNDTLKEISFHELWNVFIQKLPYLVLIPILCTAVLFVYSNFLLSPQYTSTVTLYILRQSGDELTITEAINDYNLALKLVNDCTYLLKSHTVVDTVLNKLDLSYSYENLCSRISTVNPADTRILEVSVTADSPEMAKEIIDCLCTTGVIEINSTLGFEQLTIFEMGILPTTPCNTVSLLSYILCAAISLLICYIISLVLYILDDSIHSASDAERYLGLSILGDIPNANAAINHRYRYGYRQIYGRKTPYGHRKEK